MRQRHGAGPSLGLQVFGEAAPAVDYELVNLA